MEVCTMLEGFPSVETLATTYDNEIYEKNFFGGLISTTAPTSTAPAWSSTKTDYQIGDVVYISGLKTEYICGEVGNMEYPPSSPAWQPRSANDYRQVDSMPTTKTVSSNDIVNIYSVYQANYLIGQFIDGVETITVEVLDNNMQPTGQILGEITMTEVIDFTCFACCNPPASVKRFFYLNLEEKKCEDPYIQVTFKKHSQAAYIKIGTVVVVRAINIGEPDASTTLTLDNGIVFERTKITKDINAVNMGTTIELSGKATIKPADKKRLYKKMMEYQGLTFTIFDVPELEILEGVVMGKFTTPSGLQMGLGYDTEYEFKKQGVLA